MIREIIQRIVYPKATYISFQGELGNVTIAVQASGVIGKAYTTQTGLEIADPYVDWYAWVQFSETERFCGYSEVLSSRFGIMGEVYKTPTGMDLADPEIDSNGWKQVSPTKRIFVESEDIGGHQRWWVWRKVKKA